MSNEDPCKDSLWPDLCRFVVEHGGWAIRPSPDPTIKAHYDKLDAQLRSMQGASQPQKAQIVIEGLRQIGEHAIANQIAEAHPQIRAAGQNIP